MLCCVVGLLFVLDRSCSEIWPTLRISVTRAQWTCRGGGGGNPPPSQVKDPWGIICNIKTNTIFYNMILQKVYQFLRLFTITKLLILIQSFYFTHILHSSESLVYNRFYIVYDYNHYNIV